MNQKLTIAFIAIIFIASSCRPEDDGQAKKEQLKNIVISYYNALADKDLQKANNLTTTNFIFFDDGRIFNNAVAIDSVAQMGSFKFNTTIDSLNVHVDRKDASAYYFRSAEFTFKDSIHLSIRFLESATFNKIGDDWKLRFLNSTIRK